MRVFSRGISSWDFPLCVNWRFLPKALIRGWISTWVSEQSPAIAGWGARALTPGCECGRRRDRQHLHTKHLFNQTLGVGRYCDLSQIYLLFTMPLFNNDLKGFFTYKYWYKHQHSSINPHLHFIIYFPLGDLKHIYLPTVVVFWTFGIFGVHCARYT